MKASAFLFILLILVTTAGYSQNTKHTIKFKIMMFTLTAVQPDFPPEVDITIAKDGDFIKISFSRIDSTNSMSLSTDPAFSKILEGGDYNHFLNESERLMRKHSAVSYIDSISFSKNEAYSKLVDSFLAADPKILERPGITPDRPSPGSVSVMVMAYIFTNDQLKHNVAVLAPTKQTHPEVYNLIAESLELYRLGIQVRFWIGSMFHLIE